METNGKKINIENKEEYQVVGNFIQPCLIGLFAAGCQVGEDPVEDKSRFGLDPLEEDPAVELGGGLIVD